MNRILPVLICCFLLGGQDLAARHIIGGEMTYKCVGPGRYEFEMLMYRDCYCTDCAPFDDVAYVAVYRCSGDCSGASQSNPFRRLNVNISRISQVEAPDYPCLIPPDVCVEEGYYTWTLDLPVSTTESYHISYQRCCRNVTVNNLRQPQNQGSTYTVEITPRAQELCNSSPKFKTFPPTVVCQGEPLVYDHSATDADGDQLVYEFCTPLAGGGNRGTTPGTADQYFTCEGARPNPACPPPYKPIDFLLPNYDPVQPLGASLSNKDVPALRIDPNTGVITGTPPTLGQFVVGVCVSEYRNGELLSREYRDFQFNVASCDPIVVADIKEDQVINDQEFLVNSCGEYTIRFVNESYQRSSIDSWEWRFNTNGQDQVYNDWDATVTFPGVGQYEGTLMLNPGTDCGDTARIFVNVFPDINADFSYEYDTCVAGPVQFTDLSETGADRIVSWDWQFGDGEMSDRQNPAHIYRDPGDIPVTLTVTDNNECRESITLPLAYFPVPSLIVIAPSAFNGCAPANIFFDNLSFPIDETYDIRWDFGDGGGSDQISPFYTYEQDGVYTVAVDITSPIGCTTDTVFHDLITVLPSPVAGFRFEPDEPSNIEPEVQFFDQSEGAIARRYEFSTGYTTNVANPTYTFPDTGRYEVLQLVTHPSGCTDTLVQIVDVKPDVRYYLPNAFTPNEDSLNDLYLGKGVLQGIRNFSMTIWSRWGELLFETNNPDEGWNGRKFNAGSPLPNGVYVVIVKFIGPRGEDFEFKHFATLIR